jgi:hypothetical protein
MTIQVELGPEEEARLRERAEARGEAPEDVAGAMLRWLLRDNADAATPGPDDWVALVRSLGIECGVSPPDEALSSEGLYD